MLAQPMPFAAVARIVGESTHRVLSARERYVDIALGLADFSQVTALAVDETSRARGHDCVTLAADAQARRVLFVTEGRSAKAIEALADDLDEHACPPEQITSVSIDMSPAFIKGVSEHLPNARITLDKFHVIAHANEAVNKMRRIGQRTDKSLNGLRWALLKDRSRLKPEARGRSGLGRLDRQDDHGAHRARLGLRSRCVRSLGASRSTSCAPCSCAGVSV